MPRARVCRTSGMFHGLLRGAIAIALLAAFQPASLHADQPVEQISLAIQAKIDSQVLDAAGSGTLTRFLLVLTDQADLSGAAELPTKLQKGRYVFGRLQATAARTQPAVAAELDRLGITYESLYIINALVGEAPAGGRITAQAIVDLAQRADVARIENADETPTFDGSPSPRFILTLPVGWNVDWIGARALQLKGITGKGIVIGIIDTGEYGTQPLLEPEYRGYTGPGNPLHNDYNWFDASTSGACSSPCDTNGHGTFVTGEAVGYGGPGENIGVAPGAKWIGCRGLGPGASIATLLSCLQWMLAPTNLAGQDPNPDLAPDVLSLSWQCNTCDEGSTMTALADAGIYVAAANGNAGPRCFSVTEPADYSNVTGVGALGAASDEILFFSSRGPSRFGMVKPDLTAPGSQVVSAAIPTGYTVLSGTSMSTPDVAGAVALLWSSNPALRNNIAATNSRIYQDATPKVDDMPTPGDDLCDKPPEIPNDVYGNGELHLGGPGPQIRALFPYSLPRGARNRPIFVVGSFFESGPFATFDVAGGILDQANGVTIDSSTVLSAHVLELHVTVDRTAPIGSRTLTVIQPNGGAASCEASCSVRPPDTFTVTSGAP